MVATTNGSKQVHGVATPHRGAPPRSVEVASGGIRSTQDFKDLGAALAEDILLGDLSHKVAGPVVRSILMTVRVAEYEHRNTGGRSAELADSRRPRGQEVDHDGELARKEAELMEQLEAVRKERAAS